MPQIDAAKADGFVPVIDIAPYLEGTPEGKRRRRCRTRPRLSRSRLLCHRRSRRRTWFGRAGRKRVARVLRSAA